MKLRPRRNGEATTQPSVDDIKALAIQTLQGPASKAEAVLAAAFLDARRQIERTATEAAKKQLAVVLDLRRTIETGRDVDGNKVHLSHLWRECLAAEERLLGKLVADEAAKEQAQ